MADLWASLRSHVRSTRIGAQFDNPLLDTHAVSAELLDAQAKDPQGGSLLFSDSPETLAPSTPLVEGGTLADVDFRCVLCTDTEGLAADRRYRLFIHHYNLTGVPRRIRVVAVSRGQAGQVRFGPVWKGTNASTPQAGMEAITGFLGDFLNADPALPDPDAVPAGTSQLFHVPAFTGSPGEVVLLRDFSLPKGHTLSTIAEAVALTEGIQLYVVLGDPPADTYAVGNNSRTAGIDQHCRGTFADRLIVREPSNAFVLSHGQKQPGVFFLVNRDEGTSPFDTLWTASDRTVWGQTSTPLNGGNYGRVHLVRVELSNPTDQPLHVAVIANPRKPTPETKFFGKVADLGAGRIVRVPTTGVVLPGTDGRGVVVWKGTIPPHESRTKRLVYTTAGGSAGKLNLWVVPYAGELGPV